MGTQGIGRFPRLRAFLTGRSIQHGTIPVAKQHNDKTTIFANSGFGSEVESPDHVAQYHFHLYEALVQKVGIGVRKFKEKTEAVAISPPNDLSIRSSQSVYKKLAAKFIKHQIQPRWKAYKKKNPDKDIGDFLQANPIILTGLSRGGVVAYRQAEALSDFILKNIKSLKNDTDKEAVLAKAKDNIQLMILAPVNQVAGIIQAGSFASIEKEDIDKLKDKMTIQVLTSQKDEWHGSDDVVRQKTIDKLQEKFGQQNVTVCPNASHGHLISPEFYADFLVNPVKMLLDQHTAHMLHQPNHPFDMFEGPSSRQ